MSTYNNIPICKKNISVTVTTHMENAFPEGKGTSIVICKFKTYQTSNLFKLIKAPNQYNFYPIALLKLPPQSFEWMEYL